MPRGLKRSLPSSSTSDNTSSTLAEPLGQKISESLHKSKKQKLLSSYAIESPFLNYAHPTPAEAAEVHDLLSKFHSRSAVRKSQVQPNDGPQTCGQNTNVLDALIDTILSQNTTAKNSAAAKASLDSTFGKRNFAAIADAPQSGVVDAIRQGGLANKKAATIQKLLASVKAKHGDYSLQHLADSDVPDGEVMQELVAYDGVGPKTASCVLLFCLGRDSFAVDTHVFRLSKLLGWVPVKADRVLAQAHLDIRIPDNLKYGLHTLMVFHGRQCSGCKSQGKGACPLKSYLKVKGVNAEFKVREVDDVGDEVGSG